MAIGAGIVFNVDMSELDDYVRSKMPGTTASFSTVKNYIREPNQYNPFVKLDQAYQAENDKIKNIYLKNGRLSPEQLNAYINMLQPIHTSILRSFDKYAKKLCAEFAKSGTDSSEQLKLDRILAEKKQALKDQLEKKIQLLNNLPHNVSDVLVINGKKTPIQHIDGNQINVISNLNSDEMLEYLAEQNQEKILGNQVISIESYDSAVEIFNPLNPFSNWGGKYSFNRFDSYKVNDIFKITEVPPNGYKLSISRVGLDGTSRSFYEQADKDRAYLIGVAQIAQRKHYRLNLQNFPKHLQNAALRTWVDNGRSYADVDGARKDTIPPTLFDLIVKNNITHNNLKAYCNMSKKDNALLNKQIQNQGEPLAFDDTLDSPLTLADRELLGQQISLNEVEKAQNKAKATLQKLPSDSHDTATIDRINTLYHLYLEFERKASYRQKMYELNDIFKNTGLSGNKDLQLVINQMPNSVYGQYINQARKYYADQNLVNSKNQIEPAHNFDGPSSIDFLNSFNKNDFYRVSTNKKMPYIDQYRSNLADMSKLVKLLNSDKLPQDERIAMFKALENVSANGSLDWSDQFDFLSQMPLGHDKQNEFLMAELFMAIRPQHRQYIYNKLEPAKQNAIFPYLPGSLQLTYDLDKAKDLAQTLAITYNHQNTEDRQAILIEHMLSQTSARAQQAFLILQTSPLPSHIQIDQAVKNIIRDPKLENYQIGRTLSYCLLNANTDPAINKSIVDKLLKEDPKKASYLIGQMDTEARIKLLEIIRNEINTLQNPQEKEQAEAYYANKLVKILNETQSPNLIKELANNIPQPLETDSNNSLRLKKELLLAIINHENFDNKHAFENFIEGVAQNNTQVGLITQEMIYQQMHPTQETGRAMDIANRKNVVYGKLDEAIQKKIIDKELNDAQIAYKYYGIVKTAAKLLEDTASLCQQARAKQSDLDANVTYSAKQKCHDYYNNCMELYKLAEILRAIDKELDVEHLADDKRAFLNESKKLKEVCEKLNNTAPSSEIQYDKIFQELQGLQLDKIVDKEYDTLAKELVIAEKSTQHIERIRFELCPHMQQVSAVHLIKQIQALDDKKLYFPEIKAFYAFNEKVQKQVFKELLPETQALLIKETGNLTKKAAWLKRLPAAQAKDLYLSCAEQDLSLLKLLPASHQEGIASDLSGKKLSDTAYQIFTAQLANDGKITLLKKLHQNRAVDPELVNKYKLNPQPVKEDTPDPTANLAKMLGAKQ